MDMNKKLMDEESMNKKKSVIMDYLISHIRVRLHLFFNSCFV
jgi:hypothetical protein